MTKQRKRRSGTKLTRDRADRSAPKTTRIEASQRREPEAPSETTGPAIGRKLDAMPDRVDIRDWFYQPTLAALPNEVVSVDRVPRILDQGSEGACTGFALAAVINYHLASRKLDRSVSPRMLYEMARKYDEWPGEQYEGSSARGAMIGWVRHGVCLERTWPATLHGSGHFDWKKAREARLTPGGAFFRIMHRQVRDVHAALYELGALYMTIMVHRGWDNPGNRIGRRGLLTAKVAYERNGASRTIELPIICRQGRADGGHAVALVGYTEAGFIVQNSWGEDWGYKGFVLLPYEDFMLHATDVWAAQLGVPVRVDVWRDMDAADTTAGAQRGSETVPLSDIRPYVVDCGSNGELSDSGDYWTTEADVQRLFTETIPAATKNWKKRRVLLYLHGGLNTETDAARRVIAFRDVMLANEVYPLHILWESGAAEILSDLIENAITKPDERPGGVVDWMRKFRDHLTEAKDQTLEVSTARSGSALWGEMKRNARLSSTAESGRGAMQIIAKQVIAALSGVSSAERARWEFHVAAHGAGSIYLAYALQHLLSFEAEQIRFVSAHFMAPSITIELFRKLLLPQIESGACPLPSLFIMSDVGELDDTVGRYGKSLLYLVSNSFEGARNTPLLGLEKCIKADAALKALFAGNTPGGHRSLVIAGAASTAGTEDPFSICRAETHGGFDRDPDTLNSILLRIVSPPDAKLIQQFVTRDLQ
jgi:hypothetical protein